MNINEKQREKWIRRQSCPPHKAEGRQQVKVMQRRKCKPSHSFPHPQDTLTSQQTPTGSSSQVVSCCREVGSKMDPATAPVGGIKRSISNNHINRSHLSHFNSPCAAPSPPRSPNVPSSCSLQPYPYIILLSTSSTCHVLCSLSSLTCAVAPGQSPFPLPLHGTQLTVHNESMMLNDAGLRTDTAGDMSTRTHTQDTQVA